MPSLGTPARVPRNTVNTTMLMSGWMMAQRKPSTVCLYRTATSRRVRK